MSDAAPNAFHRVVSDRQFFDRSLLPATIAALAGALLLVGITLCVAGLTQLVVRDSPDIALQTSDAVPLYSFPEAILRRLADRVPVLHSPGPALTVLAGVMGLLVLLRAGLRSFVRGTISRHVSRAVNRLREHIQRQALRCNPSDLTGIRQQMAANLFQHTAQQLEDAAQEWSYRRLTTACDLTVLTLTLLSIQWRVGIECVIPVFVCWFISRIESERHQTSANLLTEQVERELQKLTDHLNKSRIVAGYGMENLEHDNFSSSLQLYQDRRDSLSRQKRLGGWTSSLIFAAMVALPGFILARHLVSGEVIGLPSAAAMATVIGFFVRSLQQIEGVPRLHGSATVAADSINQYLLRVPSVSQVVGARFLEPLSRLLQFDQVCVETETQPDLLTNLDLRIEFGEQVALLSLDPTEAEALVSLIPRFSDPVSGQVLIDGQDVRRATLESLRAEAVIVGGAEPVFNTTVLENVIAGQSGLSRQDVIEACKIVHAESFIRQLPKGYDTHLGDQDSLLDVGQRFRLSLARAIARKPALLVIQEPKSPLDAETKSMLDDTYQRIGSERTIIFLPSRLSTVKKCRRIIVLHQGRVAAEGTHEELVRSSDLYRHWEYSRFNIFR